MSNEDKLNVKIIELILEGKQYIYKEKQKFWVKHIKEISTTNPNKIEEIKETVEMMKQIEEHPNQIKELCDDLKEKRFPTEIVAHIVTEILYYSKLGPSFFETFYQYSLFPPLRELAEKIEEENRFYQTQAEKNKLLIKH